MARQDVLQLLKRDLAAQKLPAFSQSHQTFIRTAPARLDVLGALGATAGGTLAQMALPAKIAVAIQQTPQHTLTVCSGKIELPEGQPQIDIDLAPLQTEGRLTDARQLLPFLAATPPWAARLLALYYTFEEMQHRSAAPLPTPSRGLAILIRSDIPMNAGQASSTALLAAFLLALCDMRSIKLDLAAQALLIQRAESLLAEAFHTGAGQTHIIDAMTCLESAEAPLLSSLLRFTAQPHRLVGAVALPPEVRIMALNTGVHSARKQEELAELRLAGAMGFRIVETIYKDLGQRHTPLHGYLANTSPLLYRQYFRSLLPKRMRGSDFLRTFGTLRTGPTYFGGISEESLDPSGLYRVRTAVDHLIAENEHAEAFLQAMEELTDTEGEKMEPLERSRTLQRAGRLLLASHHSYRLRIELSCRQADWLVDRLMEEGVDRGIFGARITGCGGGGTVAALVSCTSQANDAILDVMKAYTRMTGLTLGIQEAGCGS